MEKRSKIPMKYVAIVFGLIAGLAQAQEQTVAGAQKFIEGMAEEGGLTITLFGNSVETSIQVNDDGKYQQFNRTFSPDKISRTKASGPCSTKFYVDLSSPTVTSIDYTWRGHTDHSFWNGIQAYSEQKSQKVYHPQSNNGTRTSYVMEIDWAKVPAVENNYGTSISFLEPAGDKVEIFVKTKNYATRLHYAMEFLRLKCDKKSATGF